ncbi:MAG: protein kinase, partial [Dehalococcoidia bacterium]
MVESFQGGRCQVLKKLGEGGKGIVFLCQDTVLDRKVAIKLIKEETLDPEGLLRLQREVQAMARLTHPNVVTIHDMGQENGQHYLLLELMEGGDVEHLIASSPQKCL